MWMWLLIWHPYHPTRISIAPQRLPTRSSIDLQITHSDKQISISYTYIYIYIIYIIYIYMYMTHMTIVILYYIIIIWSQMISYIHTYNMYHRPPSGTSPWPWRTWEDPTYHNHLPSQIEQRCAKFHELSIDSVVGCWFQSILTRYR